MLSVFQHGLAQREEIDSLEKLLPSLHDTDRIDCFSLIAEYYLYNDIHKTDSISYFITLVDEESRKTKYNHGIAEAYADKSC